MTPIEDRPGPAHNGPGAAGESEPHAMSTTAPDIQSGIETVPLVAVIEHEARRVLLFATLRHYFQGDREPVKQAPVRTEETLDVTLERLGFKRGGIWTPGPPASGWSWTTLKPAGARRRYAARKYADSSEWYVIDWETGETVDGATTGYHAREKARDRNAAARRA